MNANFKEAAFGQDIIDQMVAGDWKLRENCAQGTSRGVELAYRRLAPCRSHEGRRAW